MRVIYSATVSGLVLTAMVFATGCKSKPAFVGKSGPDCKPNQECTVSVDDKALGWAPCVFNKDGSLGNSNEPAHELFYLPVSGKGLRVLPAIKGNPARFRDFKRVSVRPECPSPPFAGWKFRPGFSGNDVTGPPVAEAIGCQYKMTVQTNETGNDSKHPDDPKEPGTRFLCVDPHFQVTN